MGQKPKLIVELRFDVADADKAGMYITQHAGQIARAKTSFDGCRRARNGVRPIDDVAGGYLPFDKPGRLEAR